MLEQILEILDFSKINIADMMTEIILGIVFVVVIGLLIVNIRDVSRFVLREYYFCASELTKNAKILLITDMHNKQFGRNNQALWNTIDLIAPDMILVAGDMITTGKYDNTPAVDFLRLLSSKYPVYYGNGNHETRMTLQAEQYAPMADEYEQELSELPVKRLRNEQIYIPHLNLNMIGLDLEWAYYKRFKKKELPANYLSEMLGSPKNDAVNLLIAHNPEFFKDYAAWGADLVAAGHMHGGIVRLPLLGGVISPRYKLFPKYDGGLYTEGKSTMIISRGLGSHVLPLRLFNPGELVVIHMRH